MFWRLAEWWNFARRNRTPPDRIGDTAGSQENRPDDDCRNVVMDTAQLRHYAELLEQAIQSRRGESSDVEWLADYRPLLEAIRAAKCNAIRSPVNIGVGRWHIESNIQAFRDISQPLAAFNLLLKGHSLPDDPCT